MHRLLPLAVSAALLAGCSSGGGTAAEPTTGPTSGPTSGPGAAARPSATSLFAQAPPTCAPRPTTLRWPQGVPADLPTPPSASLTEVQDRDDGLTVVTFSTATSLRQGVLFLVEELPAAGFTLARGDAENTEADVPFVKGGVRGVLRMIAVESCRTDWLMAIAQGSPAGAPGGASPLLPPRPDASPLPFG